MHVVFLCCIFVLYTIFLACVVFLLHTFFEKTGMIMCFIAVLYSSVCGISVIYIFACEITGYIFTRSSISCCIFLHV